MLRADAGRAQGTGHVMRCLTLAEALVARGHDVQLLTCRSGVDWLEEAIASAPVTVLRCGRDELDAQQLLEMAPDWLVVDSYAIPASEISAIARRIRVLALVDGDARGIEATLLLDQNLGADEDPDRYPPGTLLGGTYALVRDAVIERRRPNRWSISGRPRILVFMGGSDPLSMSARIVDSLADLRDRIELTVVAPASDHVAIGDAWQSVEHLTIVAPSPALPDLFGWADIVVSATGTSAWDVCTLGIPAVFIAVVDNQVASLREVRRAGAALTIDLVGGDRISNVKQQLQTLIDDEGLRRAMSGRARELFDGNGKERVVMTIEAVTAVVVS
ncbi:PseG/SpsG family protein [Agromyces sp. Root81]|uniref:PseG/SpsG family protein n=1 Tax=Agromyces sp. Root81 TaxID=1736601 RepID=UPI00138ECC87|nr:hypothetical protein [Agromyces sp. Root81]